MLQLQWIVTQEGYETINGGAVASANVGASQSGARAARVVRVVRMVRLVRLGKVNILQRTVPFFELFLRSCLHDFIL